MNRKLGYFVALSGLLGVLNLQAETEDHLEKVFPVGPGGKLVVYAQVGSIEVKTGDRKDVSVEVFRKVTARGISLTSAKTREAEELKKHHVDFLQEGNSVIVRG